ncbi:unnamed protein product [Adineta steineri]|uniref:NAD(P)(+)--arginine ADP-ribosyltransferase n=1 Tax=Adineta steineri TaxID=433720 RepID=A0A815GY23_9BILA|nr:unnamed protein product [Adineta steineri]CAF1346651.1 unnamed protein product [Adineta steineri]
MSGSKSNPKASLSLNTIITPSDVIQRRRRMVRNYSILWLDECMDEANRECQSILTQLKTKTDDVNVFKQRDECIDALTDAEENIKSFLVLENTMAQQMMPLMNDIPQLHSVYILSNIKSQYEEWSTKWQKVRGAHTNIDDLCKVLQLHIKKCNQDSIAMSFITVNEMTSTDNSNQLEPTFMYTQIFKEIILDMKHDKQVIKEFTAYCRQHDCGSPTNIDQFENEYHTQSAIWWYTSPSFIYSMLNYALRSMEANTIINMGFFIHDLHQQIQQLHQQQFSSYHDKPFIVYRGQGLSKANFEKLQKTNGSLLSFNNFLSTSTEQDISLLFANCASDNVDMIGILFKMLIDPRVKSVPFASIKQTSYYNEEEEILFSMHTVFRVGHIEKIDNNNQVYQVELELTSDDDQQLRLLTDRIREEVGDSTGWKRLGNLLLKIGQFNKAEELYNVLLEQTSDEDEKVLYYNQLGFVQWNQGDNEKAIWYYEQALEIEQKTCPSNHASFATSYNSIGLVYHSMGEYSKALSFYQQALEIRQKTLPANHSDLAQSYNNIGGVYNSMGEYSKTLSFYEQALETCQKTLPSNHPHLATLYNNIGLVYKQMGEYSKALPYCEDALEICQKTLPSNHPSLATSFHSIGTVYDNMGEYLKALSFHEQALEIDHNTLPSNHPSLANSYDNIGFVYNNMGEYSKALSFYEKTLEIRQKTLPVNHPDLATSYNHIGLMYNNVQDYSKALSFYEKALEIYQKTLPSNHPHLAISYNNIGSVYNTMGEYSKALLSHEQALEIRQKTLSSNHPDLAQSYNNIGLVYHNMGESSKALLSHENALEIYQKTLRSNHPLLATSYNNIDLVYYNMKDYSKALPFYEKTLEIEQKVLRSNHPDLANSYNNIGAVYNGMGECSKALPYCEKALEIQQKTFPSNHPIVATSYNNIRAVYKSMREYSKALSYYERALNIWQHALPPTHSHIKVVRNNIEIVTKNL